MTAATVISVIDRPTPGSVLDDLRGQVGGEVLTPADPGYGDAIGGFDLSARHRPPIAVVPANAADVAATIQIARRHGEPITVVGGGHGDIPTVDQGVWLTTRGLRGVSLDAATKTAYVGAGCTWQDVIAVATPLGLAPVCGSAPGVGVAGLLLGGGLGPLARALGFSSDYVRSFEVVLADGTLATASEQERPDLFWALCGGKGGFGVVTAVTIRLADVTTLYGGGEYYAASDVAALLRAYVRFTSGAVPAELTTSLAILRLPDLPVLPPPLRGQLVAHLRVACLGTRETAEAHLAPLRQAAGAPILGALSEMPYAQIGSIHNDPTRPSAHATGGILLHSLDAGTADAILAVAGPEASAPLAIVEIRHLGGATHLAPEGGDAVSGRDAAFGVWVSGAPLPDGADQHLLAVTGQAVRDVLTALEPWSTGAVQINFCGSVNTAGEARRAWPLEVSDRLDRLRRTYDPQRTFAYSPGSVRPEASR